MPQSYHKESIPSSKHVYFGTTPESGKAAGLGFHPSSIQDLNLAEFGMYMYLALFSSRTIEEIYGAFDEPKSVINYVLQNCIESGWVGFEEVC